VDWEQAEADTRYLSHDLHRYSGKFIPQIARAAVELLTEPGERVLDPYVGSGTTLLEAALAGRSARGIDLNPVAVRIAAAKTTPISESRLTAMAETLEPIASTMVDDGAQPPAEPAELPSLLSQAARDPRGDDPWFEKWFDPPILDDLLVLDHAVASLQHRDQRVLAEVALSDVLRRSSRAHSGYPNVMFDRKAPPRRRPGRPFLSSLRRCIDAIASLPPELEVEVDRGDARHLPLEDGTVDAVVTHPPYIGSVPYAEYGSVSLKWFGEEPRELDAILTGGRRQSRDVVERFSADYSTAIAEMHRVLRRGGAMFVMVGRPVVKGERIDLPAMTEEFAEAAGLQLAASTSRLGTKRRANKMGSESLLFFVKP
jgi:DNA methylase